jgi:hypothetical protein
MKSWLQKPPRNPPDAPQHVDLISFNAAADKVASSGGKVPKYVSYVRSNGPRLTTDEWGFPLPLSVVDQDDLDRLVAVLSTPLVRLRDLVVSGYLNADEVAAVKDVYPEAYTAVTDACIRDMVFSKPPFELWAQNVLGVLFQKPANIAYSDSQNPSQGQGPPQPGAAPPPPPSGPGITGLPNSIATPSDRRDPAVRELTRS